MAKKLTASEATWSRAVTYEILSAGGLFKTSTKTIRTENIGYSNVDPAAATAICSEIKFRAFDFHKLNSALATLSSSSFYDLHTRWSSKKLTPNQIANILAAFCAQCEIYWDDVNTHRSTTEMEVYRKTIFGKACWDFGCFLSQHAGKATKTTRAAASRTPGAAPKSGYKASGPKSGLVKCLVGEPGKKIHITDRSYLYVILCKSSKSKKQYVYTNPLSSAGGRGLVKLGDPSGYSDCKLFFDDRSRAEAALAIIRKGDAVTVPDFVEDYELLKVTIDRNGYFLINTVLGNAYISASKLNEALDEACKAEEACTTHKSRFPEINDIDTYAEAMQRFE